ncbi:MAG: PorT family protein [Chlorobi bacterium]|nr:PorT family protein [Chlorobiota bacterium]
MLNNGIDRFIKEKMSGFEKQPPDYLWSAINERMAEERRVKKILLFWQSIAAALFLLLSISALYYFYGTVENNNFRKVLSGNTENIVEDERAVEITESEVIARQMLVSDEEIIDEVRHEDNDVFIEQKTGIVNVPEDRNKLKNRAGNGERTEVYVSSVEYDDFQLKKIKGIIPVFTQDINTTVVLKREESFHGLYAQAEPVALTNPRNANMKFVLTGSASPTYNYRNLGKSQNSSVVYAAYDMPVDETGIVSVSGGINLRLEGKSRWSFETGVLYSQVGQEVSQTGTEYMLMAIPGVASDNITAVQSEVSPVDISSLSNNLGKAVFDDISPATVEDKLRKSGVYMVSSNVMFNEPLVNATLKQTLDYIEIPFIVRYAITNKKPVISLAGGVSTNFLINNTAGLYEDGEEVKTGTTDGINNVSYSSTVGVGIELPLGKSFRFNLEPKFKYFLSSVNNNGTRGYHPYSFGVFGGVSFILNNH